MNRGLHKREVEAIRKLVAATGGHCNVLHQGGPLRGSAGVPDLYLQYPWRNGRNGSCWVEVKVGRDALSPAQRLFVMREVEAGGTVLVGDVETVMAHLKAHGILATVENRP